MYATCLFCNSALGANEALENFSVGRRLAFDSATGRLWVVCRNCERWNLSPLETRWEAIEEAERAFRGTKLRVSTDNIGLARLSEGTELVRIGKPLRPEFAAWRYGDQFGRRQRKFITRTVLGFGAMGVPLIIPSLGVIAPHAFESLIGLGIVFSGAAVTSVATLASPLKTWAQHYIPRLAVRDANGNLLRMSKFNAQGASLSPAGHAFDWQLNVQYLAMQPTGRLLRTFGVRERGVTIETAVLRDDVAKRALVTILPHANVSGAGKRAVSEAIDVLNDAPNVNYLLHLASTAKWRWQPKSRRGEIVLGAVPSSLRLALEMSMHENDERRALEGELHELEQRWKDADAIAKIADALFLPNSVESQLQNIKDRGSRTE